MHWTWVQSLVRELRTKIPHASGQLSPHATMKTQHSKQKTTSSHSPAALPSLCTCCYRSVPTYLHGFPSDSVVKNLPAMQERQVWFLGLQDPLEEEMTTHSSILAWEIPWTEEPDGLQSIGLRRVGYDWSDLASTQVSQDTFAHLTLKGRSCWSRWALNPTWLSL